MNHDAVEKALCGRYVQLSDGAGYIESQMTFPKDGSLVGAYVLDAGNGKLVVTDDGDTAFNIARCGTEITAQRHKSYAQIAEQYGLALNKEGVLSTSCNLDELPYALARYLQAVSALAAKGLKQRPTDSERFEQLIGGILELQYGIRLTKRAEVTGLSGHQLRFPFAIDLETPAATLIQTVSATEDEVIQWKAVYEAGGKFKDIRSARGDVRLIAILEGSRDADKASRFFSGDADVLIYSEGQPLLLEAA